MNREFYLSMNADFDLKEGDRLEPLSKFLDTVHCSLKNRFGEFGIKVTSFSLGNSLKEDYQKFQEGMRMGNYYFKVNILNDGVLKLSPQNFQPDGKKISFAWSVGDLLALLNDDFFRFIVTGFDTSIQKVQGENDKLKKQLSQMKKEMKAKDKELHKLKKESSDRATQELLSMETKGQKKNTKKNKNRRRKRKKPPQKKKEEKKEETSAKESQPEEKKKEEKQEQTEEEEEGEEEGKRKVMELPAEILLKKYQRIRKKNDVLEEENRMLREESKLQDEYYFERGSGKDGSFEAWKTKRDRLEELEISYKEKNERVEELERMSRKLVMYIVDRQDVEERAKIRDMIDKNIERHYDQHSTPEVSTSTPDISPISQKKADSSKDSLEGMAQNLDEIVEREEKKEEESEDILLGKDDGKE